MRNIIAIIVAIVAMCYLTFSSMQSAFQFDLSNNTYIDDKRVLEDVTKSVEKNENVSKSLIKDGKEHYSDFSDIILNLPVR